MITACRLVGIFIIIACSKAFAPRLAIRTPSSLREQISDGVTKEIITPGDGETPQEGQRVVIDYEGSIAARDWNPSEVVECWLKTQQGVDDLADAFLEQQIDEAKLKTLTEEYLSNDLGVDNKIKCKKLMMAIKRLEDPVVGQVFDSSIARGEPYSFVVGEGKAIQAMELAVARMQVGEKAELICRCDTAYRNDGLRKANGDVMVPPFATLKFEVELLRIEES